jgi:virulence factor Mce-like protein
VRRLAAIAILACAALAATVAGVGGWVTSGASASGDYRVDAIFDTAKGIIPGQLVKIAGARVGKVQDVTLTGDAKARIKMSVQSRFAPFRSDARCDIQPEGLIGENFVQCDPGTPAGHVLKGRNGEAPTVPVSHTAVPINLTDLFNIFTLPVRERFTIVLAELGTGVSARGDEINAILRRANPTLAQARRAIAILNGQRTQIAGLVTDTDTLVAELARRRDRVADFVDQAARVTRQTASRRGPLSETIRRLPHLLESARPALRNLDQVTADLPPILRNARAAAPGLNRIVDDVGPFVSAGLPAIRRLGVASDQGRRTVKSAAPVVILLRRFAARAVRVGPKVNTLVVSLRDRGVVENLLTFVYRVAATASRYDKTSHLGPGHFFGNSCTVFATKPAPGCDVRYSSAATAQAASASAASAATVSPSLARRVAATGATPAGRTAPASPAGTPAAPAADTPEARKALLKQALGEGGGSKPAQPDVKALIDYLLG